MSDYIPPRRAPSIHVEALPEEEHLHSQSICMTLHALSTYIEEFSSSLALFDEMTERLYKAYARTPPEDRERFFEMKRFHHWRKVAAQDCVMNLYHFGSAKSGIHTSFGLCKTIRDMTDRALLKKASSTFDRYFSDWQPLRNGVAHAAEKHMTASKMADDVAAGGPASIKSDQPRGLSYSWGIVGLGSSDGWLSGGSLNDSVFSTSNNNKMHSLEITRATLDKLHEVRDLYFDAFYTLEENSRNARNAMYAARQPR